MKKIASIILIFVFITGCAKKPAPPTPEENAVRAVDLINNNAYEKESDTVYVNKEDPSSKLEYMNTFQAADGKTYHEVSQYQFVSEFSDGGGRKSTSNWYYIDAETGRVIPEYFDDYAPNPEWEAIFMGR